MGHLDPVPLDDLTVFEDAFELNWALVLLDGLKRGTTANGIIYECNRLGLLHRCARLPEAVLGTKVSLGHEDHDGLRGVNVLLERVDGLEIVHVQEDRGTRKEQ